MRGRCKDITKVGKCTIFLTEGSILVTSREIELGSLRPTDECLSAFWSLYLGTIRNFEYCFVLIALYLLSQLTEDLGSNTKTEVESHL